MNDDEDYVFFGTPLPEIEDEATLRKKAAKELQVRDEKGRQRFHGAFTGGFSAGYFNTVGTKEGWEPSIFISSRGKTADRIQQNPEDFMDDEDFGEFGIATRKIHTTTNFQDTSENVSKRKYYDTDSIIPGEAPLKDIVQPVRESIGIIILKKLGWRHGQGIGPRIKKYSASTKVYGCSPFPDETILEEDDPMAKAFTFAPEDTEEMSHKPKDNYFGLGYTGLSKQSVLTAPVDPLAPTTTKFWFAKDKRKLKISGQAFGVGAFEDEDEDIYGKDDISQYDFSDLEPKKYEDSKITECLQHGNILTVLQGFQLALQPPLVKKHYPPPTLPHNFKPIHMKSATVSHQNANLGKSRHALSASDRSIILGERKFEKISLNVPAAVRENQKSNLEKVHVPSSSLSSSSSSNFRPFPNDISKQHRYEEYLKLKEKGDVRKLEQPSSMTEWEKEQELEEFAKASILFKSTSNVLSSRFESRSHLSVEHEVMAALEKIRKENAEKQVVMKKNLVGTSNRKTFEWHPVSLLCKRMNVPNPYPNSDSGGPQNVLKGKSLFDDLSFSSEGLKSYEEKTSLPVSNDSANKIEDSSNNLSEKQIINTSVSLKNNEDSPSENKKPPMDFFKDIFGSSSSEDEGGEKKEADDEHSQKEMPGQNNTETEIGQKDSSDKESENELSQKKVLSVSNNQTSSNNKKVGFGVFANIDLDALNQRKPSENLLDTSKSKTDSTSDCKSKSNEKNRDHVDKQLESKDVYGPELPPNFSVDTTPVAVSSPYKISPKKHRKSKSSHKHKHHKHKHKKKKKKSSKRSSSSSQSSEDEPDDIPPSLIIEKMKKLQRRKS